MKFISSRIHGVLDYMVALVLIIAPIALGFRAESAAAFFIPLAGGLGLLLYSMFTDYSSGLRRMISFRLHLVIDFVAGVTLLASPFVFGFGGVPRLFFAIVGASVIAVVALTDEDVTSPSVAVRTSSRIHGVSS